jgi:hypothetical protein
MVAMHCSTPSQFPFRPAGLPGSNRGRGCDAFRGWWRAGVQVVAGAGIFLISIGLAFPGCAQSNSLVLGGQPGQARLCIFSGSVTSSVPCLNAYSIDMGGTPLLGFGPAEWKEAGAGKLDARAWSDLVINGRGGDWNVGADVRVLQQTNGTDYQYVEIEAAAAYPGRLKRFHRHLLFVPPDLFVIFDDLEAVAPSSFEYLLHSPQLISIDGKSNGLRLESQEGGLIIRYLSPSRRALGPWIPIELQDAAAPGGSPRHHLSLSVTNPVSQLQMLSIFLAHQPNRKPGSGFFLLQSKTALGARIYRDGLPTLIAFRTDGKVAKANLTGLSFPGSVAVDVYRPKPRRRTK